MRASNQWVVDASVALNWFFRDEEFLPQADGLLDAFSTGTATLMAPALIRYEICNSLVVAHRQGWLSAEQLRQRLHTFLELEVAQSVDEDEILLSAVELTSQFSIVFYDALYLAMAQSLNCNFVTADRRLHERTQNSLPWVTWIGNLET